MGLNQHRKRKENAAFLAHLGRLSVWARNRIAAGDLDFDDVVYRTRDTTAVLLEIYGGEK